MRSLFLSVLLLASAPLGAQDAPAPATPPDAGEPAQQEGLAPVRVTPADVERRLTSLYEGTLLGVQDGQDFAETPDYRRLLELISRYGEGELRGKEPRDLERAAALADPSAWRGELVRVRGLLVGMTAERLSHPIGERVDVFRAIVTVPNGEDGVVIDFLHQPPQLDLEKDIVEAEAVFVRLVGYEAKNGAQQQAPYLIARDIRKLDTSTLARKTRFDTYAQILIEIGRAHV